MLNGKQKASRCFLAEAFYDVPEERKRETHARLPGDLDAVLTSFEKLCRDAVRIDPA